MHVKFVDWGSSPEEEWIGVEYVLNSQGAWKVLDKRLFFLAVIKHGIVYKELDMVSYMMRSVESIRSK